ncbi:threonylcarbamoyl-AMP synthase [Bacillus timonensis]|nr:threonylcarbamoyl-AMP synthase [Bacillus timonensis]
MKTKIWNVDNRSEITYIYPQVEEAATELQHDEVVSFPTETVYGLGANAKSDKAVSKIFEAKGRPSDNPLIVHIASVEQLKEISSYQSEIVHKLIEAFWPGPLTLVLPKIEGAVSEKVTAGLSTVAVRMPDHPIALALIEAANLPLAAPSANLSGKPSPTTADHVMKDLNGRIAGIINGGATGVGLESTVLDCTEEVPVILRPGGVTKEQLEEVCGKVEIDQSLIVEGQSPKSPGMKYTHYAPKAPLFIVEGSLPYINTLVKEKQNEGKKVGVLTTSENAGNVEANVVLSCGTRADLTTVASQLYATLRSFDEYDIDIIYSEAFPSEGVGQAIMNRLLKAAGNQIISQ